MSIDDGQEHVKFSVAEEGELSSEAGTYPNVVHGSPEVRSKWRKPLLIRTTRS